MPAPDWLETRTQPIGAGDLVDYLREALDLPETAGREIELGGPQVVTHLELVEEMAAARTPRTADGAGVERDRAAGDRRSRRGHRHTGDARDAAEISLGLTTPSVVSDRSGEELFGAARAPDAVLAEAVDADEPEAAVW